MASACRALGLEFWLPETFIDWARRAPEGEPPEQDEPPLDAEEL